MRNMQKESLASRCLASGKFPVFISNVDYDRLETENGKPVALGDIKRGMSLTIPGKIKTPFADFERNNGFQVDRIYDCAVMDKDIVIESRSFICSTIDFSAEYNSLSQKIESQKEELAEVCIKNEKTPFFIRNMDLDNIKSENKTIALEEIESGIGISFTCSYKKAGENSWRDGHCTVGCIKGVGISHGNLLIMETDKMLISSIDFSKEYDAAVRTASQQYEFEFAR